MSLRSEHKKGATLDDLADKYKLSRYQVHRRIIAEKWRCGEVVISEKSLRQCVKKGMTVRQMADKYFCSTGCISKKLKGYGIKMRQCGNPNFREHS